METIADLQKKEVININDGTRLGFVYDVEIDINSGKIVSLFVPKNNKMWNMFGKPEDYTIPWEKIKRIGDDIILISE